MITVEKWWEIMMNYNISIFPFQIIFHIIAVVISILFFLKPKKLISTVLKFFLTFYFTWISIVFFLILGTGLDNYIFSSVLFLLIGFFFGIDIFRNRIEFELPEENWEKILMGILLTIVFIYPLIGMVIGHTYPKMIFLGTFPCATAAFALVLLAFSIPKIDLKPYILLLIWSIPFPIFIQIPLFGVYEDSIMLIIGLIALVQLIRKRKELNKKNLF